MRLFGSLRSRVFAAAAVVAVLPLAAALLFVSRRVTDEAEAELRRGLQEAARLAEQYHRTRLELAAERAELIADLPKLKAAASEADPRTIEPVALDYRDRVRSDVFVVTGRDGRTLVALGTAQRDWPPASTGFRVDGDRLLETVGVPILLGAEAPETLGRLTLGFALDDAFARRLRALTGSQVAVVQAGRVFATTLPRSADAVLVANASADGISRVDLGREPFEAAHAALAPAADAPRVLVLRSRAEALRPLRTLRTGVLFAAFGAVAASVLLSWAVARTVTRPLAALTESMKEIAATGDLGRRIAPPQPWDDEDARLLSRTFGTLTDSIARFQRQAALRDRLSALGRMSTVVAHEVRNPLMIIKGTLRTLERGRPSEAEMREAAADIAQQVSRLDRVVGDVLDFARPLRIDAAAVDPSALAREAAGAVLDGSAEVTPRFALDPSARTIVTDGERLRAVLVNLIENARDTLVKRRAAEGRDGAADEVEIGSRALDGGGLRLWVSDRGQGMAPADAARAFEPYFTTKRTGTGLGLAIARKVIEGLGGAIRLESREGEGTRVEIDLPAACPSPSTEVS